MKQIVSGILLLDKPQGLSSQQAVSKAKWLLKSPYHDSKKAGHTGTLDPMATGLLPICFGEATKFAQFGLDANKGYQAIIKLGDQTDTGDADGQMIAKVDIPIFSQETLNTIAQSFVGTSLQTPPMYSALKKDGKKLYEYARAGVQIDRPARAIEIYELVLTKLSDDEIALSVVCSKGTYVRVLGEDIAKALGTLGHLTALRRTQTGGFKLDRAISLERLEQLSIDERLGVLLPMDSLLTHLPKVVLDSQQITRLRIGQRLNIKTELVAQNISLPPRLGDDMPLIRLYGGDFAGLGEIEPTGRLQPKKMVNV